jgi:RNA polymerase sigma-70 factor (ECF subfamily)
MLGRSEDTMLGFGGKSKKNADLASVSPSTRTGSKRTSQKDRIFEAEAMPHMHALFASALRLTRNPADAEDLVQESFMKAYRAFDQFEPGTNCKAWMLRIQMNTFINRYRRKVKEREILEGSERATVEHYLIHAPSKKETFAPEDAIADRYLSDEVKVALEKVPVDFRMVVELSDIHGLTYKEIADAVDIPVGTVMSRLFRGRRILQDELFAFAVVRGVLRPGTKEGEPVSLDDFRKRRARKA